MQRRIERADGDRVAVHRTENADEVLALKFKQRGERAHVKFTRTFDLAIKFARTLLGLGFLLARGFRQISFSSVELRFKRFEFAGDEDHLAHAVNAVALEEHMLGATKTDA